MNPSSKKSLIRYLNRLDRGDPDALEESKPLISINSLIIIIIAPCS